MRIASLNLGRRLRACVASGALPAWLVGQKVEVLCVQEICGSSSLAGEHRIPGYELVDGNGQVAIYAMAGLPIAADLFTHQRWQTIRVGYLSVHNVYLSARSSRERTALLVDLRRSLSAEPAATHLVIGDFNLAPTPEDGLIDGAPSRFNTTAERRALASLLRRANLLDLGARGAEREFTREVRAAGRAIQFRCDLALLSRSCFDEVVFAPDHSVRQGAGFTDHSALVLDLPIDLLPPGHTFVPGNTAKPRSVPSRVARAAIPALIDALGARSVLDFGCGRGVDVEHYRSLGLCAAGYDPHLPHGFSTAPEGRFDLVVMTYVLNTLPEPGARSAALLDALRRVKRRGVLAVAVRNRAEVAQDARSRGWPRVNDGFYTSELRGTFVKGMSGIEVLACLPQAPRTDRLGITLPPVRGTEMIVVRRR